ncbi:hypothetical protein GMORB2_6534 [Geosmithia morbida]|uniref:Uncharacterized protein n=1 Tax=Geosmithia morbida TaxID=1094350 RepID=A0A9P5D3Y8_9HYPO|nr:uncharacterized protein GMORB2_6534 [Geosmithia morbida]KAF4122986.1 hypothetical protein GMORB2_6534 [Geosmithia morbida]
MAHTPGTNSGEAPLSTLATPDRSDEEDEAVCKDEDDDHSDEDLAQPEEQSLFLPGSIVDGCAKEAEALTQATTGLAIGCVGEERRCVRVLPRDVGCLGRLTLERG